MARDSELVVGSGGRVSEEPAVYLRDTAGGPDAADSRAAGGGGLFAPAAEGGAAGAGANIALACDIVVASENAAFIQAFSQIGLIPDSGGTFFLPRLIGFQKASALAMLGDKVSAKEAEELGMIYKHFSAEEFEQRSIALAEKLAKMPTQALAKTKKLLNQSMTNSLDEQLELEGKHQIESAQSQDYKEGVAAFVEKRKPEFEGK
jgi:2-(1,2-epoxy-1,2-dihydrophenyl)acetyl-CoA isomerase